MVPAAGDHRGFRPHRPPCWLNPCVEPRFRHPGVREPIGPTSVSCLPTSETGMPDDLYAKPQDSLRLDPPIAVPEPAPLAMPRRPILLLPFALPRLALRPTLIGRSPDTSGTG